MPVLLCLWALCHLQQIEKECVSLLLLSVFAEACWGGGREEQKHLLREDTWSSDRVIQVAWKDPFQERGKPGTAAGL